MENLLGRLVGFAIGETIILVWVILVLFVLSVIDKLISRTKFYKKYNTPIKWIAFVTSMASSLYIVKFLVATFAPEFMYLL